MTTPTFDTRIAQRWAVDPLESGCPFNVDTEASDPVCIVNEDTPGNDRKERNANRHYIARRIVAEHNALLGIAEPERAIQEARETIAAVLALPCAKTALTNLDKGIGTNTPDKAWLELRKALAALTPAAPQ